MLGVLELLRCGPSSEVYEEHARCRTAPYAREGARGNAYTRTPHTQDMYIVVCVCVCECAVDTVGVSARLELPTLYCERELGQRRAATHRV